MGDNDATEKTQKLRTRCLFIYVSFILSPIFTSFNHEFTELNGGRFLL